MSWQRQQQQRRSTDDDVAATAVTLVDVRMRCPGHQLVHKVLLNSIYSSRGSNTASSSKNACSRAQAPAEFAEPTLSKYSSWSADFLMQLTTSCQLEISTDQRRLKVLLTCFRNLKHLQVEISYTPIYVNGSAVPLAASPGKSASAVTAAAAEAPCLESLTLILKGQLKWLHDDLLLPLAAASGSGSSLRKLQLQLVDDEEGIKSRVASAASSTCTSVDITAAVESVRGLDGSNTCWQHALRHLHGLHGLTIINACATEQLTMLVEHLPQSLQVFSGSGLNISSSASITAAASDVSSAVTAQPASSSAAAAAKGDCNAWSAADMAKPHLMKLDLDGCQLSDPNILASTQLQQLTISNSSWPGGWTAAATAWPEVRDLVWKYDDQSGLLTSPAPRTTCGNCCTTSIMADGNRSLVGGTTSSEVADAMATLAAATRNAHTLVSTFRDLRKVLKQVVSGQVTEKLPLAIAMQEISSGFRKLRSLSLTQLSWLSVEVLQPVMQHMGEIRSLHLGFSHMVLMVLHTRALRPVTLGMDDSSSMKSYLTSLQQWLQQQLPCANVCLYIDYGTD